MTDTIHIDVRRMSQQTGETIAQCQTRAEDIARVFVAGCRYAGRDVRATSGGYGL